MRQAFIKKLTSLALEDNRIVLLYGDIGNKMFNEFRSMFPDRSYNCGVAEANMTSIAAGLALGGLRPVTYTIASFNTVRCLEQIRIDVCYHKLPVIIVGMGAGISYMEGGATHQAVEDIAMLRSLPNMKVVCPGDAFEVEAALCAAIKDSGPVYLRLGKKNEPVVHKKVPDFNIGKAIIMKAGQDICLVSTGNLLPVAMEAATTLEQQGISASVASFHTIKPLDQELLHRAFTEHKLVITLEEHSLIGGLGAAVAEWLVDNSLPYDSLLRLGTPDEFFSLSCRQNEGREMLGLDAKSVANRIIKGLALRRV